jgi:hypothetical protein
VADEAAISQSDEGPVMTARSLYVVLFASATFAAVGCRPKVAPSPGLVKTAAPAATDFRKLSLAELQDLIKSKTGFEGVTLKPEGPNRYIGTVAAPGGGTLPLVVTVEAERIVCDTRTPAGSTTQVITPNGLESSNIGVK